MVVAGAGVPQLVQNVPRRHPASDLCSLEAVAQLGEAGAEEIVSVHDDDADGSIDALPETADTVSGSDVEAIRERLRLLEERQRAINARRALALDGAMRCQEEREEVLEQLRQVRVGMQGGGGNSGNRGHGRRKGRR